jgi:hypothetical protein
MHNIELTPKTLKTVVAYLQQTDDGSLGHKHVQRRAERQLVYAILQDVVNEQAPVSDFNGKSDEPVNTTFMLHDIVECTAIFHDRDVVRDVLAEAERAGAIKADGLDVWQVVDEEALYSSRRLRKEGVSDV